MKRIEEITGILEANPNGYGFVKPLEEGQKDIYIAEKNMNGAFHKDTVSVVPVRSNMGPDRPEGRISRVIEHGTKTIVGIYKRKKSYGYVIPDDRHVLYDIRIPESMTHKTVHNQKVVVRLIDYGKGFSQPMGEITEILGFMREAGTDMLCIAKSHELPVEFPKDVLLEAEACGDKPSKKDMEGRKDLRDLFTVTIDGEDAKDLDDAISLTKNENGSYELGVHIADVSHYVKEGSALDREAYKRGTSVYFPDRVIPMLPKQLSNGICSLNAGTDRLSMSCLMTIDPKGNIVAHEICETVIHVDRRLSYTGVQRDLDTGDSDILPFERLMEELSALLRAKRFQRGAVDFDFPESKIILNSKGRPEKIVPYERNTATKIIEDFMLAANETVAEDAFWQELPFLYRIHEKPSEERLANFLALLGAFGYSMHLTQGELHPKEMAKLLEKIEGTDEEPLLSRMMLRAMKQAKYSEKPAGHFGLASDYYSHFTSPIRRYPDLQIHRILKENLKAGMKDKRRVHYTELLPQVAADTSRLERRAEECEREADKIKKAQYMRRFLGEEFEGSICGMTRYGMYVELPNTVEGLVHVSELDDDYYNFVEDRYLMVGERTGRTFRLGQKVKVLVSQADEQTGLIDFRLAYERKNRR